MNPLNKKLKYLANYVLIMGGFVSLAGCTTADHSATQNDLNYETIYKMNSYQNCDKDSANCTHIEFTYPQFGNLEHKLSDSVSHFISRKFEYNGLKNMDSIQRQFMLEYEQFKKTQPEYQQAWVIDKSISILNQTKQWIIFMYTSEEYTGGAHSNSLKSFHMMSKSDGHQYLLTDFFDKNAIHEMTRLGEPIFCAKRGINPNQGLDEAGFMFPNNHFQLNENFYIDEDGITFYYNTYEVAPYSMGPTEITIPASKVFNLLRKN